MNYVLLEDLFEDVESRAEWIKRFHAVGCEVPVILMTRHNVDITEDYHVLKKPFTADDIVPLLNFPLKTQNTSL